MRLKRLQLQGYKTFASKTDFLFGEGITAIVGPNGSGKSNVADALRWVLGEQSFSALRGKRGTDMIFTGSQSRPRAGLAQAILTLDNSDGWLPIDYTEVEIGRRTYRSGDTEYLLNGQKVRLMDITELLATSGLAERTYTIIGQGLVDQALSLRAEERRALFEEAAGISHYQSRRAETLRRLQETQRNLQRVHDILAEIRPRLASLKRQASRAQNYAQVEADLRHLLRIWYGYQWDRARRQMRLRRQEAQDAQRAWEEGRLQLLDQQATIGQQRRLLNQLQQRLNERQKSRDDLREQREQARRQVAILQERQTLLTRQLAEIEQELPQLAGQHERARQELDLALADLEKAQASLAEQQGEFRQFNASLEGQASEIRRWEATTAEIAEQRRTAQNRLAQVEGQIGQLRERLQERQSALSAPAELARAETAVAEQEKRTTAAETAVATIRQQREQAQQQRRAILENLKALRQAVADHRQALSRRESEIARLEARREMLDQLRRQPSAVDGVPLIGQLASLITIPPDYRRAIEAVLASRLTLLIVADERNLWQLVAQNQDRQAMSAAVAGAIAPPPAPDPIEHPAVVGWAADLVTAASPAQPLIWLLLGRVLLVRERQTAYEIGRRLPPGAVAVTVDGLVVHAGGLVETSPVDPQQSVLAREEAWRATMAELETQKATLRQLQEEDATQQQALLAEQTEADRLNELEQQLSAEERLAAQRLADAQRELDRARQGAALLRAQQAANAEQVERLASRLREAEEKVAEQQTAVVQLEAAHGNAQSRLAALPVAELAQQRQSWRQKLDATQTIVAGRQAVVDSRRATLNQAEELLRRRQARRDELRRQQEATNLDEAQLRLNSCQRQMAALDAEIAPLEERLAQGQQQLDALEQKLEASQRHTHELENYYTQSRVRLSQQENQLEGLHDRIKADLGLVALNYDEDQTGPTPLPISEIVEQLPDVEELPEDIESSIQRYRGQLQRMGAINPDAPVEYDETQNRYDFLTQQVDDLNATEKQLRNVIDELDELTSRAFADTVQRVDAIFGRMFSRLFGGGSARLVLTEPDDLTVSGVDIVARLPSRREQGLGLLSGGERSLTAAALIFALLKVAPPPFCVMDEVDAMLDEANVTRFREALTELARETQFIVITHNRGTVQAARTVYGISMGQDSASQVLSIKPEDYVNGSE